MTDLRLVHDLTTDRGWDKYRQDTRFQWVISGLNHLQEQWQTSGDPRRYRAYLNRHEYAIGLASTDKT